jgi:hypothetical protein
MDYSNIINKFICLVRTSAHSERRCNPNQNRGRRRLQPKLQTISIGAVVFGVMACMPGTATTAVYTSDATTPTLAYTEQPEQTISVTSLPDTPTSATAGPLIENITTNEGDYPNNQVPRYEKFEITFQVDTVASNLQMPYDSTPPPGIESGIGISVDAQFSPDNWATIYTIPGFYYQEFQDEIKSGDEWFYPMNNFAWKIRFAPDQVGSWQFKLIAQDAGGYTESSIGTFSVVNSNNKGFVRVSQSDPRYFELEDGSYFPGLGYNMNFSHVSWENPILENENNFQIMSANGIQLVRIWLSQWAIYGSAWNPWNSIDPNQHGRYIPLTGLTYDDAFPGSEVSMRVNAENNPCMFIGFMKAPPAVKRNTTYRVRIRYKTTDVSGPRIAGQPYGFVAKTGAWLWGDGKYCYDFGEGVVVTSHQDQNTSEWQILEGSLQTGNNDFLPYFYLVMENANQGTAYVDHVWIEEDLGNGSYGPNIVSKPWMGHHQYMEQRNSYAFDKVVELAKENGIYLRPVIHEKNDGIFTHLDHEGNPIPDDPLCYDEDPNNDPEKCPSSAWFYGNGREMTKARWLQKAWWRYLSARWGYATSIHSWELLNEGDPGRTSHYTMTDELGKYVHQFAPNGHMVSTSFWHSFPSDAFWANPSYPDVDYADYHRYIDESDPFFEDAAGATYDVSMQIGANQPGGAGKPIIRGETGFVVSGAGPATDQFQNDTEGVWLHNFIWGGINAGGMIESYWYENVHIYDQNRDGTYNFDHRHHYGAFYNFIKDIPLNNGNYQDADAVVSNDDLRVWGQKDIPNGSAYLWIQNKNHTWRNVVDGINIPSLSGTITISGFQAGETYSIQWWDPYQSNQIHQVTATDTLTAETSGTITLPVNTLTTDIAVKIFPTQAQLARTLFLPILQDKP